jgi:cytochrome c556
MTYTTQNDLSTSVEPTPTSTVQKIKKLYRESSQRSQRVTKILKTAFSEAVTEVKDGRAVISPLAKEVTAETVATFKEQSQKAADTVNQTWQQKADAPDRTERFISVVRALGQRAKVNLLPQLKQQAVKLDGVLSDRYGQRYTSIKEKAAVVRSWYAASEQTTPSTAPQTFVDDATSHTAIEVDSEVIR